MEFLQKVIQLYAERKEWFLDLFAAHVGLALTAAVEIRAGEEAVGISRHRFCFVAT